MAGTNGKKADRLEPQGQLRDQARGIVQRIMAELGRRSGRSPREVGELLGELGWLGRGDRKPLREEAVRNWLNGVNPPAADILVGLALHIGMSLDEYIFGSGLRAGYDRLQAAVAANDQDLARLRDNIDLLAWALEEHVPLSPQIAAAIRRLRQV